MGVLEVGGDLHFVDEALYPDRGGQVLPEDLDRDLAAMPAVPGEVHVCHSAFAQLALDFVAIGEGGPELLQSLLFQQISHRIFPLRRRRTALSAGLRPPASPSPRYPSETLELCGYAGLVAAEVRRPTRTSTHGRASSSLRGADYPREGQRRSAWRTTLAARSGCAATAGDASGSVDGDIEGLEHCADRVGERVPARGSGEQQRHRPPTRRGDDQGTGVTRPAERSLPATSTWSTNWVTPVL